jgi:hypothetical protein
VKWEGGEVQVYCREPEENRNDLWILMQFSIFVLLVREAFCSNLERDTDYDLIFVVFLGHLMHYGTRVQPRSRQPSPPPCIQILRNITVGFHKMLGSS